MPKLIVALAPVPATSFTVTLTVSSTGLAGSVPEITPVEELIDRPAGSPLAE